MRVERANPLNPLAHAVARGAVVAALHGGEAVGGTSGHGARSARAFDPHRTAVGVRSGRGLGIAEDVVEQRHQCAQSAL
jgi:hypothetical protein